MRSRAVSAGVVAAALALTGCVGGGAAPVPGQPASPRPSASSSAPTSTAPRGRLQHIVLIVDENKPAGSVIGNAAAPYLNRLARTGALATDYRAVAHPSLPNYLALTSGTTAGITTDCAPSGACLDRAPNLAQTLDRADRSWKMYAESMPRPCAAVNTGRYAVKHNPFLYFPSVTADAAYCAAHDVPYADFAHDLSGPSTLPDFSFISPDLCNDMHDCSIATGDRWLAANVPAILGSPAFTRQRSLLIITFDEGDSADNRVACVLAGPAAAPHTVSAAPFTHYSLLRTIEQALGLPPLASDARDTPPLTALMLP